MQFLDQHRMRNINLVATNESFRANFDRHTNNILDGLDWGNLVLAGDLALSTLLCENPRVSPAHSDDIILYIHGLSAEEANAKLKHIWDVWRGNLPSDNSQRLAIKNLDGICFYSSSPHLRIKIELRLHQSIAEVLFGFDLDQCAIAYDGIRVLMLPRCARALETGYSIFTTDLIWGHGPGHRQKSRIGRLSHFATRGFGLRILPVWIRSLEQNPFTPDAEPSLKTMLRRAFIAEDMLARQTRDVSLLDSYILQNRSLGDDSEQERWKQMREKDHRKYEDLMQSFEDELDDDGYPPEYEHFFASLTQPNNAHGLASLEALVQFSDLFNRGVPMITRLAEERDHSTGVAAFDSIPLFPRLINFNADSIIDADHRALFDQTVKVAISELLHLPYQANGYVGYLTRQVRRQICGPDLKAALAKQLTIPLLVPHDLETFIMDLVAALPGLPGHFASKPMLVPLCDPTAHSDTAEIPQVLPQLRDNGTEEGNLRYWVITNRSMWSGQNPVIDEIFEVFDGLFHFLRLITLNSASFQVSMAQDAAVWYMARLFKQRAILPPSVEDDDPDAVLDRRERELFRAWVFKDVLKHQFNDEPYVSDRDSYPSVIPEELFWQDGLEGEGGRLSVPQWKDVAET